MKTIAIAILACCMPTTLIYADDATTTAMPQLTKTELGQTKNVHNFGKSMLCGQPTAEEFAKAKELGIQRVITLREDGEVDWDQAGTLKKLGLEFHELGFRSPESLTDELLDKARKLLVDKNKKPVMLHCGSANRVGAIWAAHRALDEGLSVDEAMKEAKEVGLRNADYEKIVIDYIQRNKAKAKSDK